MVNELNSYTGVPANWDNRATLIAKYLLDKQGKTYTYAEIAKSLKIPTVEVSRYLREESFERRTWDWFLEKRKCNRKAYNYYLQNFKNVGNEIYVNFSKHSIFRMTCRLMNFSLIYRRDKGRKMVYVFENTDDLRTEETYATAIGDEDMFDHEITDMDDMLDIYTDNSESFYSFGDE